MTVMVFADYGAGLVPLNAGGALAARIKTVGARVGAAVQVARSGFTFTPPPAAPSAAFVPTPTGVSYDQRTGTCPPGWMFQPGTNYSCPPGAMCKANLRASCRRDAIQQVVDSAIPAPPVSPGVPVGPLVPKDCPPGQYRPIGSAIGAPCVPLPPSTPGVAPPLLSGRGVPATNVSADWKTGTCPPGYRFRPGAKYEASPGLFSTQASRPPWCEMVAAAPTSQLIVSPQIVPPPPPQVAPQPVPPATQPAPVPIPVQVQPGTAAAAAVETINTAAQAQAQLTQQQVQAAQAGMGPALGVGVGGLLLMALLLR